MEFYIDLSKSVLNFAKLTKKMVQVRGKNGKIFTRMQWVSPQEASTGHGIRMISSKEGLKGAMADGVDKHPHFHEALKDQGVHPDNFENHHPHFFVPETKESVQKMKQRHDSDDMEWEHISEEANHHYSYEHGWGPPEHIHTIYGENDFVKDGEEDKEHEAFLRKHNIHPEINHILQGLKNHPAFHKDADTWHSIGASSHEIRTKHWNTIKSHIEASIRANVEDKFIRNVQLGALKEGDMKHMFIAGQHPQIARKVVDLVLGEQLANKFREDMKDCNLSINFPGMNLDSIQKNGYSGSTMENYVKKEAGEEGWEALENLMSDEEYDDEDTRIEAINKLGDDHSGMYDVYTRAKAEYDAIGLHLEDRKPTYIAFNPMNEEKGAADYFGNRWLKVTDVDNVLNHCTVTMDDSFNTSKSFARVESLDHLKDIFLLKVIDKNPDIDRIKKHGEQVSIPWHSYHGDIPLELQYHQPKLEPHQFEIQPDHMKKYEKPKVEEESGGNTEDFMSELAQFIADNTDLDEEPEMDDDLEGFDFEDLELDDDDDLEDITEDEGFTWEDLLDEEDKK